MRKMRMTMVLGLLVTMAACGKINTHEPAATVSQAAVTRTVSNCGHEWTASVPLKVGETGIMLPIGTKVCISKDESTVDVQLPEDFIFIANGPEGKKLPVPFSTYTCLCSREGSPCKVFYAEGLGFGCLQYSCAGSCTGKFTYMGYSVDKVVSKNDKEVFLSDTAVQSQIRKAYNNMILPMTMMVSRGETVYVKQEFAGVSYYFLVDRNSLSPSVTEASLIPPRALCECEGTRECKLRTVSLRSSDPNEKAIDIYFCDGRCNGCELTVD